MKKRLFSLILVFVLLGSLLAGCGKKDDVTDTPVPGTETESSVVESETSTQGEGSSQDATEVVKDEKETTSDENTESESKDEPSEEPEPPVHEHAYTSTMTKEPTCAGLHGRGERLYTCSCGDSYTEIIYCYPCEGDGVMVVVQEPDCQNYGIKLDHCKWCGRQMIGHEIPKTEHVPFDDYIKIKDYLVLYCSDCGYTIDVKPAEPEQPAHVHTYKPTVTKEPGCYYARKDGELTYTCSCGDSYVEVLEFLPCSDLSDGIRVTVREPDCQHEGKTCEHCKYCGQELYPGTLPKTEHVPSEWLVIESQGKRYKVCVNCGITLEKEDLE